MSKRQSIGIASLVLGVVALIAYGIYTTARIRTLERRLGNAEERLRKVESDRQPRVDRVHCRVLHSGVRIARGRLFRPSCPERAAPQLVDRASLCAGGRRTSKNDDSGGGAGGQS